MRSMRHPLPPVQFIRIPVEILQRLSKPLKGDQRDASAVPSYLHGNPLVRWIINKRLQVIVSFVQQVLATAPSGGPCSALDFGCGTGVLIPSLSPHLSQLYLTDYVMDGARLIAEYFKARNVVFVEPEVWSTVLPDESLTLVIAADALEHMEDPEPTIRSFHRKLVPGGSLVVSGPTETSVYNLCRKIARFSGEYHAQSIFDIERVIHDSGFKAIVQRNLPFPILPKLFRVTLFEKGA